MLIKLLIAGLVIASVIGAAWAALDRAYDRGFAEAQAKCDSENLRAKLETLQRLADSRQRIIEADAAEDARLAAEMQALQERNDVFASEFAEAERRADLAEREAIAAGATVVARCRPDPDAAGRVRRSWGR